jgi:DNA-binding response OmpR family regulator
MTLNPTSPSDYRPAPATPLALVIDSDDIYRDLVREMLEELGWKVETAWNGQVGSQLAQLRDFDLVICEIVMPQHDGLEAIHSIRSHQPGIHVVAMSGGGALQSELYLKMARWFGADATLAKPFGIYDLCAAMRGLYRKRNAADAQALPAFDRDAFRHLEGTLTPASLRKLASQFSHEVGQRLDVLRIAAAQNDNYRIRQQAGALKNSAALFGLARLSNLSATLEGLALVQVGSHETAIDAVADAAAEGGQLLNAELR